MLHSRVVHVIDDDPSVLEATALLLQTAGYQVKTYPSGSAFLENIDQATPGCIVLDVHMSCINGLEVQRRLNERGSRSPVIMRTARHEIAFAVQAMKAGAFDYLEKPCDAGLLLKTLSEAFVQLDLSQRDRIPVESAKAAIDRLSPRELDVLRGLLAGLPNKLIAYQLGLSIRTVEAYRARVMDKLEVRSISAAVRLALAGGLAPTSDLQAA